MRRSKYNLLLQWITALLVVACTPAFAYSQESVAIDPLQYSGPAWSPYLVGALIGVLSMFTFYFSNKALGASSAYAKVSGMIGQAVAPKQTNSLKYFRENKPKVDWGVMLVVGIIVGAFLAAWHGSELTGRLLPEMWQDRFGSSKCCTPSPRCIGRRCLHGVWCSHGWRLYERSRHQWNIAIGCRVLGLRDLFFHRRYRDSDG